jgi:hypothetical protein
MAQRPEAQYQSYLLRLWRNGEGRAQRAMLEHVDSHERHGFADLESLYAFLCEQTNGVDQASEKPGAEEANDL